jgi:hypothetical protein
MVESGKIGAYWMSSEYRQVANFSGEIRIQNTEMADLNPERASLHQVKLDFGIDTILTVTFRPTNPIPRSGWIKVVYPTSISIKDEAVFLQTCQVITSSQFRGPKYCNLVTSKREIWLYNIFDDSRSYASTIQLEVPFTNPTTNFFGETS